MDIKVIDKNSLILVENKIDYSNFNQFSHQPHHRKNIGGHIEKQCDEFYLDFEAYTNYIANADTLDNYIKTIFFFEL